MRIAVAIVSYNGGELLEQCLAHLTAQTCRANRLLVIDNASDEPATQMVLDNITSAELVRLETNQGYGAALNIAANMASDCDYLCCLNQDAFAAPDFLEKLQHAAKQNQHYGSFASLMLSTEHRNVIDGAGDVLHVTGLPWRRFHGKQISDVVLSTEPVFSACGGAVMYSLDAYNAVGGFDESFFMYIEDVDLGFRLQNSGRPCLFVHDAVVQHIGSATTGYRSDFSVYYGHRNLIWCYLKNMPAGLLLLMLPFHLLMTIMTLLLFIPRGQFITGIRAKLDGYRRALFYVRQPTPASTPKVWSILDKSIFR